MNDIFSNDTDRALKFGLFLDSLCAGVSAMPQDAARAGRASTEPQSPLRLVSSGDHRLSQEGDA